MFSGCEDALRPILWLEEQLILRKETIYVYKSIRLKSCKNRQTLTRSSWIILDYLHEFTCAMDDDMRSAAANFRMIFTKTQVEVAFRSFLREFDLYVTGATVKLSTWILRVDSSIQSSSTCRCRCVFRLFIHHLFFQNGNKWGRSYIYIWYIHIYISYIYIYIYIYIYVDTCTYCRVYNKV